MQRKYTADEILSIIRDRCGIQDSLSRFSIEIEGIETEIEKLDDRRLMIRTDRMEQTLAGGEFHEEHNSIFQMVEIMDTVYKPFNPTHTITVLAFLTGHLDESKKPKPIPFRFVLKVFKDRQGIADRSDRFVMSYNGTEMELESKGEERIVIRASGVKIVAGSLFAYLDPLDFHVDAQYLYENFNAANPARMTVLEEIRFQPSAERAFQSIMELLLSYYETILMKSGENGEAADLIAQKTWKQADAHLAGQTFQVFSNPQFA
ncbi:hypothetical protein D3P08_24780 [Paenibacillus nanensis]|uniref:Uncharacterized protein n=1 Tax=Paenibacillus nanensis TaxID=393251 RepID=A0A3A1UK95_9BACL|nr:hypothetical protein [Paenibacillus nanensis]RIX47895.1 hypothetical protein D3P08_24780 [Paenibacillus nanensis]